MLNTQLLALIRTNGRLISQICHAAPLYINFVGLGYDHGSCCTTKKLASILEFSTKCGKKEFNAHSKKELEIRFKSLID
jgi:hypothetical protein